MNMRKTIVGLTDEITKRTVQYRPLRRTNRSRSSRMYKQKMKDLDIYLDNIQQSVMKDIKNIKLQLYICISIIIFITIMYFIIKLSSEDLISNRYMSPSKLVRAMSSFIKDKSKNKTTNNSNRN